METKSVFAIVESNAALGWSFIVFTALGAAAQIVEARRRPGGGAMLGAAITVLAFVLGCWQVKLMPYASWRAVTALAVFVARLDGAGRFSIGVTRVAAACLVSQAAWMVAFVIASGTSRGSTEARAADDVAIGGSCLDVRSFAPLSRLTPGLVASDLELGPYIVVTTEHRVVAAPYHRLEAGITANHAILTSPPAQAIGEIRRLGVNYIALCQAIAGRRQAIEAVIPDSLEARLLRNEPVAFLDELTAEISAPIRIWRVAQ